MNKKIRVVQIGTQHDHAFFAFEAVSKLSDKYEIIGYFEPDDKAKKVANQNPLYAKYKQLSLTEVFERSPDAVIIETTEQELTNYALMFAQKGIHIHMDKPGGCSLAEFESLIKTVKNNNIIFHTGYMYRYNPALKKAEELIKSGTLGEIYSVETHMSCTHPKEKRDWLERLPGGMMFYLGCHLIDIVLRFMGKPDRIVPYNFRSGFLGATGEDNTFCLFEYKNGVSFAKTTAIEPSGFARRQVVICGTRGTYEIKPLEDYFDKNTISLLKSNVSYSFADEDGTFTWKNDAVSKETFGPFDRYMPMMNAFAEMVCGERKNPFTPDYELELYRTILIACGLKQTISETEQHIERGINK